MSVLPTVENVEYVASGGQLLCFIIRAGSSPDRTTFLTPPESNLQVGYIVYAAGQQIPRHVHLPTERHLQGTSEVLVVQEGCCEVDIYSGTREFVASRRLEPHDVLVILGGGHGFRLLEHTVLLEVKQGPYCIGKDKERF
jgi:hypothetical protein